jgi:hypothetical protein
VTPVVVGYIELSEDAATAEAFVGTRAYSPMLLAAAALASDERVSVIVVPEGARPEWCDAGLRELCGEKLKPVRAGTEPDIAFREPARGLRAWSHAGSLNGLLMTTDYCTHVNPARTLAASEAFFPGGGAEGAAANSPSGEAAENMPVRETPARYVLVASGRHGFLTPQAVAALLAQAEVNGWREPIYIADGPTGLVPSLWSVEALNESAEKEVVAQRFFWERGRFWGASIAHLPTHIVRCRRSFALDTRRGREFCAAVAGRLGRSGPVHLDDVVRAGNEAQDEWAGALPRDVEIEITGARPFDPAWLPVNPRAGAAMSRREFAKIVGQFALDRDSVNLTLGGFGDPLMHPEVVEFIRIARPFVRVINVRTFGAGLSEERFAELTAAGMDVLTVRFGSWGEGPYREVNRIEEGRGGVDAAPAGNFEQLLAVVTEIRRKQVDEQQTAVPMVVAEVVKTAAGDRTLLEFIQYCRARLLWPMVVSAAEYGGAVAPMQTLKLYPGVRTPCLRVNEQMLVYADGSVPLCSQDAGAARPVGNLLRETVADVWRSATLGDVRADHAAGVWVKTNAACAGCNEWCRLS